MTLTIIITVCILLLIAYIFDLTFLKTKIPSVILLLLLGGLGKFLTNFLEIQLPDFSSILPVFGTIGLVLIVLEGSLELELKKSRLGLIKKSFMGALFPMLILAISLAYFFHFFGLNPFRESLINAIPFCVISSAVAIPSVKILTAHDKEFVIYESSFSDILGVVFFNFIVFNESLDISSLGNFGLELSIIALISFLATIGLSFLLNKIEHVIKFIPIILLIMLIYAVSKVYHLPALIFILLFGLFLGNLDELKHIKWIKKLKPDELDKEVKKFREITIEAAFLVRALFFIVFGYQIEAHEILNTETLSLSVAIVAAILIVRIVQLKLSRLPLKPLLFIAPRGLITILLFLEIQPEQSILLVNKSSAIQVIILTALVMMIGLMITDKKVHIEKKSDEGVMAGN